MADRGARQAATEARRFYLAGCAGATAIAAAHTLRSGGGAALPKRTTCAPMSIPVRALLLVLCSGAVIGCGACAGGAAPRPLRIVLERDQPGCHAGLRIEIDGSGELRRTVPGKARCGIAEQTSVGRIDAQRAHDLATRAEAAGFFGLPPHHSPGGDSPATDTLADGAWTMLTIEFGGRRHAVFSREEAGPELLRRLQAEVLSLAGAHPP
jgi:hypothetical protein